MAIVVEVVVVVLTSVVGDVVGDHELCIVDDDDEGEEAM